MPKVGHPSPAVGEPYGRPNRFVLCTSVHPPFASPTDERLAATAPLNNLFGEDTFAAQAVAQRSGSTSAYMSPPSSVSASPGERPWAQPAMSPMHRLLHDLKLAEPSIDKPAGQAVRRMLEAVTDAQRVSFSQALQPFMALLKGFAERVAFMGAFVDLPPSEIMAVAQAVRVSLPQLALIHPEKRLGMLQAAVHIFALVRAPERLSVAHAVCLQNLGGLSLHERQRVTIAFCAVPHEDRLEVAYLSAQLCQNILEIEGFCAVIAALAALSHQRRMDVAEAVGHFMMDGTPGLLIAKMLTATAALDPDALAEFAALMLEVRWAISQVVHSDWATGAALAPQFLVRGRSRQRVVPKSQRPDALALGMAQACTFLATLDSNCQRELVAFLPRLLDVAADEEALLVWMRALAPVPLGSWEKWLDRFDKLQAHWEETLEPQNRWTFFVNQIMPMEDAKYKMYLWAFNRLHRPQGDRMDQIALLIGLARLSIRDMPVFVYTLDAFDEPGLRTGEPFLVLVNALSRQPQGAWERHLQTYEELQEYLSKEELVTKVLTMVRAPSAGAE